MFKKINSLILLVLLVNCSDSYAQVGIGTENPTAASQVSERIQLRGLKVGPSNTHHSELRSDSQGNLTAIASQTKGGYFDKLLKQCMGRTVTEPLEITQDLKSKRSAEATPYSEVAEILSYNIPVFMKVSIASLSPVSYYTTSPEHREMFVDVIQNNSEVRKVVEYTLTNLKLSAWKPIPDNTKTLLEINYSLGVQNGSAINASVFDGKSPVNKTEEMLSKTTRTFTFVTNCTQGTATQGRTISHAFHEEIANNTANVQSATHKVISKVVKEQPAMVVPCKQQIIMVQV